MKTNIKKSFNQPQLDLAKATSKPGLTCNNNWRTYLKSIAGAILTLVIVLGSSSIGLTQPVISLGTISVNGDTNKTSAIEGDLVVFQVNASANVTSNLPVMVSISQTGDFIGTVPNDVYQTETAAGTFFPVVAASGGTITPNQVSIPMGEDSVLIGIQLEDDQIDEVNGSITVSLMGGAGYTVTSDTEGATQTMNVFDNETDPEFSIESRFTKVSDTDAFDIFVVANKASTQTFTINLSITAIPSTLISNQNQTATVSFAKNETRKKHTIRIESGIATSTTVGHPISISISPSTSYDVDAFKSSAIVNVVDGDSLPEVTISGSSPVGEGSPAEFTISLQATGGGSYTNTSAKTINLSTSQTGDFIFGTPFDSVTIPANSSSTVFAVATKSDGSSGSTPGNITTTLEAGEDYKLATTKTATVTVNDSGATQKPLLSITDGQLAMAGTNTMAQLMVTSKGNPGSSFSFDYIATNLSGNFLGSIADTKRTAMNLSFTETPASSGMYQAMLSFPIVADSNQNTGQIRVNLVRDNTSPVAYTVDAEASSATINVENATFLNPVITLSRQSIEVEEGHDAIFVLQADRLTKSAVNVKVRITQTGNFVSDVSERTVSISSIYPIKLEIATTGDAIDEPNGSVTATILDDSSPVSYTAGTTKSQTIGVFDNDQTGLPVATISGASKIDEGQKATFDLTLNPTPSIDFDVKTSVAVLGNFFNAGVSGISEVDIAVSNGTGKYELPTVFDSVSEVDGGVIVTILADDHNPPRYSVGGDYKASTTIQDNDFANLPVLSIARDSVRVWFGEGEGLLGHTISATAVPTISTNVRILVSQEGNFIVPFELGIYQPTIFNTSLPFFVRINDDREDEPDGSVTVTILSDTNDPPRYSVSENASVTTFISDDDLTTEVPKVYFDTALSDTGVTFLKPFELTVRTPTAVSEDLVINYNIGRSNGAPPINEIVNSSASLTIPKGMSSATVVHSIDTSFAGRLDADAAYVFIFSPSANYTSIQTQYSPNDFMDVAVKENNPAYTTDPVVKLEAVTNQIIAGQNFAGFRFIADSVLTSNLAVKYGVHRGANESNFIQSLGSGLEIGTANISSGQTTATVQIATNIGSDQVAKESTLQVFLLDGQNYAVIAEGNGESASVTISNNLNVSITPKNTQITEGGNAEFVMTTSKAITRLLAVNVNITQTGNYFQSNVLSMNQLQLEPNKSTNGTEFNISLPTRSDDGILTATGAISVEVLTSSTYNIGANSVAMIRVQDTNANTKPIITISRSHIEVEEGNDAIFMLQADKAPSSEIMVSVGITQSGNFVSDTSNRIVKISDTQPQQLMVQTTGDIVDSSNGSVTATILPDTAPITFTAGTPNTQTIRIIDNDYAGLPNATITSESSEIEEGQSAVFNITLSSTPNVAVSVNVSVMVEGSFFASSVTPTFDEVVTINNGMGTLQISTLPDTDIESDGKITTVIREDETNPPQYSVGTAFKATTNIKDNDFTGLPIVTIARKTGTSATINEDAGTLEHTITATATPASGTKVRVMFSQEGSFIADADIGTKEYDLATSVPIMTTIVTNSMDEDNGSVKLTILSDTNDPARYSVGSEASVTTTITDDDPTAKAQIYFDTSLSTTGVSYLQPFELTVRATAPVREDLLIPYYISRTVAPSVNGGSNNVWTTIIKKGQSSSSVIHTVDTSYVGGADNTSKYIFLPLPSTAYTNIQSQHSSGDDFMTVAVKNNNPATSSLPVIKVEPVASLVESGQRFVQFRFSASRVSTSMIPIKYRVFRGVSTSNFVQNLADLPTSTVNIMNLESTSIVDIPTYSNIDQVAKESVIQVFLFDGMEYAIATDEGGNTAAVTISNDLYVSIAPKSSEITEGETAEYLVTISRELTRGLTVNVQISQTGDYVGANEIATNTILLDPTQAINGTQFNITLPTRAPDSSATASGTIKYEIVSGSDYHVGTNAVADVRVLEANVTDLIYTASVRSITPSVVEGIGAIFEFALELPGETGSIELPARWNRCEFLSSRKWW